MKLHFVAASDELGFFGLEDADDNLAASLLTRAARLVASVALSASILAAQPVPQGDDVVPVPPAAIVEEDAAPVFFSIPQKLHTGFNVVDEALGFLGFADDDVLINPVVVRRSIQFYPVVIDEPLVTSFGLEDADSAPTLRVVSRRVAYPILHFSDERVSPSVPFGLEDADSAPLLRIVPRGVVHPNLRFPDERVPPPAPFGLDDSDSAPFLRVIPSFARISYPVDDSPALQTFGLDVSNTAWAFVFDGHVFYVLNDIDGVTLIGDLTTQSWYRWYTGNSTIWNMHRGVIWKGRVIAADALASKVWELDPASMLDEEQTQIQRAVTGFQAVRGKASMRQGSLRLTASVGEPSLAGAQVLMRFSDDEGQTWSAAHSRTLNIGDFAQLIRYRSLGRLRAPGRIWEIVDVGGLVTIEGADADMEGE